MAPLEDTVAAYREWLLFAATESVAQSLAYAPWVPLQFAPRGDYDIRMGELFFDLSVSREPEYNTNILTHH